MRRWPTLSAAASSHGIVLANDSPSRWRKRPSERRVPAQSKIAVRYFIGYNAATSAAVSILKALPMFCQPAKVAECAPATPARRTLRDAIPGRPATTNEAQHHCMFSCGTRPRPAGLETARGCKITREQCRSGISRGPDWRRSPTPPTEEGFLIRCDASVASGSGRASAARAATCVPIATVCIIRDAC